MKTRILTACAAVLLLSCTSVGVASAHASLDHANIKNGQVFHVAHAPHVLQAFFAEDLDPGKSWVNVFDGTADHGLINEKTRSRVNPQNPKELILQLPKLGPHTYYFVWYTHSAVDGHFAAGIVYFRVIK